MENVNIQLFDDNDSSVKLPSISDDKISENLELTSESILPQISGDVVDTLVIPSDISINDHNYIFDFSELDTVNVMQKSSLKSLISKEGDIELYLYRKNGLISFGKGNKYKLERLVPLIKVYVFNNKIKIYKDFKIGEAAHEVKYADFTKLRMNL